jgi:hypothetical protein
MSLTWGDLKTYIENQDEDFLDNEVRIYDFTDGEEYDAGVTELLFGEDEEGEGWVPYLTINEGDSNESDEQV